VAFSSPNGPSVCAIDNSNVLVAFRGQNSALNVVGSGASGQNFGSAYTSPTETCIYSPAIAYCSFVGGARAFLAWKGSNNGDISLAELTLAYDQPIPYVSGLTKKGGTLFSVASRGPALVFIGGQLWMAYTASDTSVRYLSFGDLTGGGNPVASAIQTVPGSSSPGNPTICSTNGRGFFIAWTGMDGSLNIYSASQTGFIWNTGPAKNQNSMSIPGQGSIDGPSLAYIYDRMYLAWTDGGQQVNTLREDKWQQPAAGDVRATGQASPAGPGLTAALLPGGSFNLNIAAVATGSYDLGLVIQGP
jgi:hypothetical protein